MPERMCVANAKQSHVARVSNSSGFHAHALTNPIARQPHLCELGPSSLVSAMQGVQDVYID